MAMYQTFDSPRSTKKQDLDTAKYFQAAQIRKERLRTEHFTTYQTAVHLSAQESARYERLSLETQLEDLELREQERKQRLKMKQMVSKAASLSEARRTVRQHIAQQDGKLNQSMHLTQPFEDTVTLMQTRVRAGALSVDLDRYSEEDYETQPATGKQELKYVLVPKEGDDVLKVHILGEGGVRRKVKKRKKGKRVRFDILPSPKSISPQPRFQRLWGLSKAYPSRKQSPSPPPQRHEIVIRMKNYYDSRVKAVFSPTVHQAKVIQNQLRKEPVVVHRAFQRVALDLLAK